MTQTTKPTKHAELREGVQPQAGIPYTFDQIDNPGCYVSIETGRLLRIPPDALAFGRSPLIEIVGEKPWVVMKISNDPFMPLSRARMSAADFDLPVNF